MASHTREQRFLDFMRYVLAGHESGQEISIPRKARRLDVTFLVREPPSVFGPLGPLLRERAVVFEQESRPVTAAGVWRAHWGGVWLGWRHALVREGPSNAGRPSVADAWLAPSARRPLAVVVADRVRPGAADLPGMRAIGPGYWRTLDVDHGGLILLDLSALPEQHGWSFWRMLSRASTPAELERRLLALLTDESFPTKDRVNLMEAIAMDKIPTTLEEKRAALERERADAFKAGEQKGKQEGKQEGKRAALLGMVALIAPQELARLEALKDDTEFETAVAALMVTLRQRSPS
jgi:hypothetical protein